MPSLPTLITFIGIVAAFAAAPGPSNLFVVAQGLRTGRRQALLTAVGCACGAMVYVAVTTLGLAALLAPSAAALSLLHYLGGAYLIVLGIRAIRSSSRGAPPLDHGVESEGRFVRRGLFVEVSNPKVALFFLAFFPQFVRPDHGAAWSQILVLGCVFCLVGLVSDSLYAMTAGTLGGRLRQKRNLLVSGTRVSAALYLGLGAWAISSGARQSSS
jgi:threonine/homoserine/homoserine lactone efflux protein